MRIDNNNNFFARDIQDETIDAFQIFVLLMSNNINAFEIIQERFECFDNFRNNECVWFEFAWRKNRKNRLNDNEQNSNFDANWNMQKINVRVVDWLMHKTRFKLNDNIKSIRTSERNEKTKKEESKKHVNDSIKNIKTNERNEEIKTRERKRHAQIDRNWNVQNQ